MHAGALFMHDYHDAKQIFLKYQSGNQYTNISTYTILTSKW